jgi:Carboxypeptidase regulatory-like domain/TonB dependent receptor
MAFACAILVLHGAAGQGGPVEGCAALEIAREYLIHLELKRKRREQLNASRGCLSSGRSVQILAVRRPRMTEAPDRNIGEERMTRLRLGLFSSLAMTIFLLASSAAHAQLYPGRVTGTVQDSSGAVVVGADVKLTSPDTGLERSSTTDASGVFNFPQLPLGTYRLTVVKQGFKTFVQLDIVTSLDKVNEIPVTLVTGAVNTQVEVTSEAPLLQTQTDIIGGDFSSQEVEQLPLGNSDYTRYAFFLPGTSTNTDYTFTQIAINGSPSRSVIFNIDGSQNMDAYRELPGVNQGGNSYTGATRLPPDAVEEISVVTGGAADTEPGAGAINVVLKSGTNDFHGTVYESHRDASLEAHNFFENLSGSPKAHFIWNEYGGSIGGPIVKDKTFFFVAYDGSRSVSGSATAPFFPSTTEITNAESYVTNTLGLPLNPVGQAILAIYAPYTAKCGSANPCQIANGGVGSQRPDDLAVKVDQHLGEKDLLTARYLFGNGRDAFPQGSDSPAGGSQLQQFFGVTPIRPQNGAVSEVHNFSPSLLNTTRVSYNHIRLGFFPADSTFNPNTIGLDTGAAPQDFGLPEVDLGTGEFENLGVDTSYPRQRTSETFQLNNDLVFIHGKHSFQFGANWESNKVYGFNDNNFRGILTFDGSQVAPGSGFDQRTNDLIDLLAGFPDPSGTDINRGSSRFDLHQNVIGFYGTDTFQVTKKLTLIAGLRWDWFGVPVEDRGRFTNFLPSEGLVPVNQIYHNSNRNFSPRLSVAYSPLEIHGLHTVIRAGYGIFYINSSLDMFVGQTFNFQNSNPGLATNPLNGEGIYSEPYYAVLPNGNAAAPIEPNVPVYLTSLVPVPPENLIAVDPNLDPRYLQSWNLNLEQEITHGLEFQIGYVGSKGTHIYNDLDKNQPPAGAGFAPGCVNPPNAVCEQEARPFFSEFPQFGQILTISSGGNSAYNALQAILRTKNYHGLTMQFGYTWAHDIDEASETMDFFGSSGFVPRDSTNLKSNRSDSEFDVPQAVSFTYVYQIPSTHYTGAAGQVLNNWQLSGVVTYHDSMYLPDLTFDDISGTGEGHDVPNCVGPVVTQYKNFSIPAVVSGLAEPAPGTFGDCPRNMIPGPHLSEWDFSLGKFFPITERFKLQFRADGFNILNHTNFGNPFLAFHDEFVTGTADNVNNDSHFGAGAQRQFQLNLKLFF